LVRKGGKPTTLLPLMVLSAMVTFGEMKAPRAPTNTPPPRGARLLPAPFVLSRTVMRARARWPTLPIPPPFLTVRSDSSAEHRLSGRLLHEAAKLRFPPAIAVLRAPAPAIWTSPVAPSWELSGNVPAGRLIRSRAPLALASPMAARSVHCSPGVAALASQTPF
jgi:hypothetical protein